MRIGTIPEGKDVDDADPGVEERGYRASQVLRMNC